MALQILYFIPGNLQAPAASFEAVVGRLLVSPVLQVLVFGNARQEVRLVQHTFSHSSMFALCSLLQAYPCSPVALSCRLASQRQGHDALLHECCTVASH